MGPQILNEFRQIVGKHGLICEPDQLRTYECDALTNFRVVPKAVLLPSTSEEVQGILRICYRERIPFVARTAKRVPGQPKRMARRSKARLKLLTGRGR